MNEELSGPSATQTLQKRIRNLRPGDMISAQRGGRTVHGVVQRVEREVVTIIETERVQFLRITKSQILSVY